MPYSDDFNAARFEARRAAPSEAEEAAALAAEEAAAAFGEALLTLYPLAALGLDDAVSLAAFEAGYDEAKTLLLPWQDAEDDAQSVAEAHDALYYPQTVAGRTRAEWSAFDPYDWDDEDWREVIEHIALSLNRLLPTVIFESVA